MKKLRTCLLTVFTIIVLCAILAPDTTSDVWSLAKDMVRLIILAK